MLYLNVSSWPWHWSVRNSIRNMHLRILFWNNSQPYLLHYGVHFYIVLCLCVKCTWTLGIWLMWPGCWYTCDPLHQCGPVRWPSWAVQVWGCQLYPAGRPANVPRSAESTCPHCYCDFPEKKKLMIGKIGNFKINIHIRRLNEST